MSGDTPPGLRQGRPAHHDVETREETIARVAGSAEAAAAERGTGSEDPSTGRGLNQTLALAFLRRGAIGAVVGAVLGLTLSIAPGPFETSSVPGAIGYVFALAIAGFLIAAVIGSLLVLDGEDGRVEREVERDRPSLRVSSPAPGRTDDDTPHRQEAS